MPKSIRKAIQIATVLVARLFFRLLGVKSIFSEISSNNTIVASNHITMTDFLFVPISVRVRDLARLNPFYTMTANKYLALPLLGAFLELIGGFPSKDRGGHDHGIEYATSALLRGDNVAMFPEGGLPVEGRSRKPRSGIEIIANKTNANIVPVYIHRKQRKIYPLYTVVVGPRLRPHPMSADEIMGEIAGLKVRIPKHRL